MVRRVSADVGVAWHLAVLKWPLHFLLAPSAADETKRQRVDYLVPGVQGQHLHDVTRAPDADKTETFHEYFIGREIFSK
jgi:hypothetical protein